MTSVTMSETNISTTSAMTTAADLENATTLTSTVAPVTTAVTEMVTKVTEMVSVSSSDDLPELGSLISNTSNSSDHTYRSSTFIQTVAGEGIAGVCVWAAILITCHQIYQYLRSVVFYRVSIKNTLLL